MEKRTLYAFVAFLVLGLGAFLVMRAPEKGDRSGPKPRPVPTVKAADIVTMEVTSEKQDAVTLEKNGDKWRMKAPKDWPADAAAVKSLTEALEKMTFGDTVTETKDKHEELGVADGKAAHVVAKGAGGKLLADLFVGKNVGGFTMVRQPGKNEVWQSTGLFNYLLNKDAKAWRDHVIFEFASNEGDKLTIESGANKLSLSKIVDKENKGEAKWKIDESTGDAPKTSDALDATLVNGAVQSLSTLRATDFADDKTDAGPAVVKLGVTAGAKSMKLTVGASKGDESLVQAEGNPTVFIVKKYALERVAHRPADFRDKTLAKIKEVDLASVDVTVGTESITLTHAGDKWKSLKPAAAPIDDAKVKPVVSAFENLAGGSISEEKDPAKTGLAKPSGAVTLHLKDKSAVTLKIGALTADKADYFVQKVGSADVLMVKKYLVDRFLKKPADLAPAAPKTTKSAAAPPAKKK